MASDEVQPLGACNCTQVIGDCPLSGACQTSGVIYRAEVVAQNSITETYTGLREDLKKNKKKNRKFSELGQKGG